MKVEQILEAKEPKEVRVVSMDMPMFLRALEFAREDAESDLDLHAFAEKCEELMETRDELKMKDYKAIIAAVEKSRE